MRCSSWGHATKRQVLCWQTLWPTQDDTEGKTRRRYVPARQLVGRGGRRGCVFSVESRGPSSGSQHGPLDLDLLGGSLWVQSEGQMEVGDLHGVVVVQEFLPGSAAANKKEASAAAMMASADV